MAVQEHTVIKRLLHANKTKADDVWPSTAFNVAQRADKTPTLLKQRSLHVIVELTVHYQCVAV